jgi:hypothetical protein
VLTFEVASFDIGYNYILGKSFLLKFMTVIHYDRTPLKKQGFVSQDPTRGFSMKRECANTHISIQYYDIQVIK